MATLIQSHFQRAGDTYLLEDVDIRGGYRSVATITERNNIPPTARRVGMIVYCIADRTEYQLIGSIVNSAWSVRPPFSGKVHQVAAVVDVGQLRQYNPYTFEQYAKARVIAWFNALPEASRILSHPMYFFKILCAVGAPASTAQGSVLPAGTEYLGEVTFVYDNAGSQVAVTFIDSSLVSISKTLMPLGDNVVAAMNEYADRKNAEANP